ncbi:MAG TPA: AAA family ATPase [Chthonomonadaceae bacterium]|nr:AAA family ATPase [Chthonomonadaceae bacterium]
MKILVLRVEGFRSLKDVGWQPGDLNILIGPNGSGKSNLLRLLELISASARGKLQETIVRSGGIDSMLWDGKADKLTFGIKVEGDPSAQLHTYTIELRRFQRNNSYIIDQELLDTDVLGLGSREQRILRQGTHAQIAEHKQQEDWTKSPVVLIPVEEFRDQETLLSEVSGTSIASQVQKQIAAFRKYLESWTIYNDVLVHADAPVRQPVVTRLEKQVAPDGQNLISVLHTLYTGDRNFKHDINAAMQAAFGDDFDELIFPPAADQRIQMRVRWKTLQREQSTADLSDGTLRFLFLMTVLANPEPPALIAIDEPETGLHPSMLPIIADFAVKASHRTQVIFTTHSAEFLDAFTDVKPTTTVARWENGETSLQILDEERLDYWLKEYTLGKLYRSGELENMAEDAKEHSETAA